MRISQNLEAFVLPTIIPVQPNQQFDILIQKIPNLHHLIPTSIIKRYILRGAGYYFNLIQKAENNFVR